MCLFVPREGDLLRGAEPYRGPARAHCPLPQVFTAMLWLRERRGCHSVGHGAGKGVERLGKHQKLILPKALRVNAPFDKA